ncbi:MAG: glycosyltransferase [Alphaproteobacteria bacterium]|nr:glycosyltransferase [Alphaproteobacteria bacterium]
MINPIKNPKISVVLPVYNVPEEWLRQSIESILNQTFSDFELIIINDGSNGNEDIVIQSYTDPRIRYEKQANQGLAKTLNKGLTLARGEFIARMDDDDISLPDRFEKQIDFFYKHPEISILGSSFEIFPEKKIIQHPNFPTYFDFLKNCVIAHPSVMFRKNDLEKYNLQYNPEFKCEDYELWSRAIRYLNFANLQDVLLRYRWHGKNLSTPSESFELSVKRVKQNMLDFLTKSDIIQEKLNKIIYPSQKEEKQKKITLKISTIFKIPILKIRKESNSVRIYLFKLIPILKIKIK